MNSVYRNIISLDWMTLILGLSLLLLALSKYFFKSTFSTFLILPFNNKYLAQSKKKGRFFNWFHILITLFQLLNISLFVFLAYNILSEKVLNAYPTLFSVMLILILTYLMFKILLQLGNGYFFENITIMNDLIFEKLTYFNYGGIVAFFGNVIVIYILQDSKLVIYATLFLILFINGIGLITILRNHQKLIVNNILYFILYLCTLEISPIVIIGSYLKD
ncbi:DUF4271 domain-containing protein [Croceitalea rosinachiae]|uniref:DUF4271 domain-containing protein n=1 Tax=Croceitalea rosinachiae TaxID=3075596 RepID=A0ABU3A8Y9_9FLAO|nr:DUF4271 domain-containing protein [Croceitalea sp. F388]MDT0606652.1 DUF4271 domain-containing protein [Croceitalea sp. F388]